MTNMREFLKALQKDPELGSRLKKRAEFEEFKEQYEVEKATPLKCPACAPLMQSPGSLYYNPANPTRFVCRKCKLIYTLECHTLPNEDLIANIRLIIKGDKKATLEWGKRISKEPEDEANNS